MHFTTAALVASLALVAPIAAQSSLFPACIQSCTQEFATSSWCNGDETGEDLANCTCQSLNGSLLLDCMHKCSPEDQGEYAKTIQGKCRDVIFPDAVISDDDSSSNSDDSNSSTTTGAGGSSEATTTTEDGQPSQTSEEGAASDTGAAMGLEVPAALAAGGLFAAFLL